MFAAILAEGSERRIGQQPAIRISWRDAGTVSRSALCRGGAVSLTVASARANETGLSVAPARAPVPPTAIGGTSSCPGPDAVWAELVTLIPHDRLKARLAAIAPAGHPAAEIVDLGESYRILAAGQARDYRDASRDCASRARVAAVFTALSIDPADLSPAEPSPAKLSPAPPPVTTPEAPRPVARLDLGVTAEVGFETGDRGAGVGVELRCSGGRRSVGPQAGVTALLPVDNTIGRIRVRQWRLPLDVGLRANASGPRLERYIELGVAAALLSERALDLVSPKSQTTIEVGLRLGMGIHAAHARVAPFAALSAELVPRPPAVFALPAGTVGHTPYLWIGATAGLSLGFF